MDRREALEFFKLSRGCRLEDIKKAYRRLALKYHPDVCDKKDDGMFLKLSEAYELLLETSDRIELTHGDILSIIRQW